MPTLISPARVDFTRENGLLIYRGSEWVVPVTVCNRENLVDTPISLDGFSGKCCIKKNLTDDTAVAEPTVEISETETGLFIISLNSDLTQNIPTTGKNYCDLNEYFYEVRLIEDATGSEYRALYGSVYVSPSAIDSDD